MPIEVNHCVNSFYESLYGMQVTNSMFLNPFWMALCLVGATLLILFLIGIQVPRCELPRTALYLFLMFYAGLVVHFSLCRHDFERTSKANDGAALISSLSSLSQRKLGGDAVKPNLSRAESPPVEEPPQEDAPYSQQLDIESVQEEIIVPKTPDEFFSKYL